MVSLMNCSRVEWSLAYFLGLLRLDFLDFAKKELGRTCVTFLFGAFVGRFGSQY